MERRPFSPSLVADREARLLRRNDGPDGPSRLSQRLQGFNARTSDETIGVIEGVSLAVRGTEGQLRFVPVEGIKEVAERDREVRLRPSVEPHGLPRHRSIRRFEGRWRVDVSVDVPRMEADYWLAHCRGFLVNAPGEDVGVVDDLLLDAGGRPETLVVRTRGIRGRMLEIPTSEVVEIVPELRTICLNDFEGATEKPSSFSAVWAAFERRWGAS
jgi:hypothetical protein